jgi:hypothetical protein
MRTDYNITISTVFNNLLAFGGSIRQITRSVRLDCHEPSGRQYRPIARRSPRVLKNSAATHKIPKSLSSFLKSDWQPKDSSDKSSELDHGALGGGRGLGKLAYCAYQPYALQQ